MALKYHVILRRDLRKDAQEGDQLYYGQVRTNGKVNYEELCEDVSSRSTASSGDIKLVVNEVAKTIARNLTQGRVVELGELGNFRMSASSKGVEEEKDFSASCFKKGRVVFTPGALLRDTATKVGFEKLDVKTVTEECTRPHTI